MRFYEFEAKRILAKQEIPVVEGALVQSAAEAERAAAELGSAVVLKAQSLYPGKAEVTLMAANAGEARSKPSGWQAPSASPARKRWTWTRRRRSDSRRSATSI